MDKTEQVVNCWRRSNIPNFAYSSYCFYEILPVVKEVGEVFEVRVVSRFPAGRMLGRTFLVSMKPTLVYVICHRHTQFGIEGRI